MMVMGDDEDDDGELNAGDFNNLLKGWDELPSWHGGFSPHSCP